MPVLFARIPKGNSAVEDLFRLLSLGICIFPFGCTNFQIVERNVVFFIVYIEIFKFSEIRILKC